MSTPRDPATRWLMQLAYRPRALLVSVLLLAPLLGLLGWMAWQEYVTGMQAERVALQRHV